MNYKLIIQLLLICAWSKSDKVTDGSFSQNADAVVTMWLLCMLMWGFMIWHIIDVILYVVEYFGDTDRGFNSTLVKAIVSTLAVVISIFLALMLDKKIDKWAKDTANEAVEGVIHEMHEEGARRGLNPPKELPPYNPTGVLRRAPILPPSYNHAKPPLIPEP
ncbi:MAG: hypothetical protein RR382_00600 [Tannerellaceae bacterium]